MAYLDLPELFCGYCPVCGTYTEEVAWPPIPVHVNITCRECSFIFSGKPYMSPNEDEAQILEWPSTPRDIQWKDLSDRAHEARTKCDTTRHRLFVYKKHIKQMANTLNVACRTDYGRYYVGLNKLYSEYIDLRGAIELPPPIQEEAKFSEYETKLAAQEGRVNDFYTKAAQYQTAKGFFGEDFNPWCTEILGENGNIGVVPTPTQETDADRNADD